MLFNIVTTEIDKRSKLALSAGLEDKEWSIEIILTCLLSEVNLKDFEGTKSTKFIGDVIINHTLLNTQLKESLCSGQYIAKLCNNK